jgi:hypothetical protein
MSSKHPYVLLQGVNLNLENAPLLNEIIVLLHEVIQQCNPLSNPTMCMPPSHLLSLIETGAYSLH